MSDTTLFSPIERAGQYLNADAAQIQAFCDALFRYAESGYIQFRMFRDKPETGTWGGPWESADVTDLTNLVDIAGRLATKAARVDSPVVFAPPLVVLKSTVSATEADIAEGVALSVDCDAHPVKARTTLTELLGEPTCIVYSGGQWSDPNTGELQDKVHLHWRLQEPTRSREDHVLLKECRRLAGILAGSDHSAIPLVHPLRWPGSWHRKGEPRLVTADINADRELDLYDALERLREQVGEEVSKADRTTRSSSSTLVATDMIDLLAAVSALPNEDLEWEAWNRCGMALWAATGGSSAGLAAWHGFSEKSCKYDASATTERWRHFSTCPPTKIGAGSLFHMTQQASPGWRRPSAVNAQSAAWARQDQELRRQIAAGDFGCSDELADQLSANSAEGPVDGEIARLAALTPQQYFASRDAASKAFGLTKGQLDECVRAEQQIQKRRAREKRGKTADNLRGDRRMLDIGSDEEIANRIMAEMLASETECIHSEGAFYSYTGRMWQLLSDAGFQRQWISPYDGACYGNDSVVKLNKSRIESIMWLAARNLEAADFFGSAEPGINCESGFVRFHQDGRPDHVPHASEHRSRHILPGHWAVAEQFKLPEDSLLSRFLSGLFRDDEDATEKQALLQEVAGAVVAGLGTRLGQPKAIVLYGRSANNGKSNVLELLEGLVGASACSHVSPHRFDYPNAAIAMRGKALNTSAELTTADVIQSDIFKSAITGEPVPGKILYKDLIDFRPIAQHVIATNKLPPFGGGIDKGIRRRLLVLVFNRVIPQHEIIPGIAELILRDEYELLLSWAIEGAARLIRNGKFTLPKSSIEALEKWTRDTDPVRAWIQARVRPTENPKHDVGYKRTELFQLFEAYAIENGYRKERLPKCPEFIDRLAEDFPVVLQRFEQDRRVRGITVLHEDWADTSELHECDTYIERSISKALYSLFDEME